MIKDAPKLSVIITECQNGYTIQRIENAQNLGYPSPCGPNNLETYIVKTPMLAGGMVESILKWEKIED